VSNRADAELVVVFDMKLRLWTAAEVMRLHAAAVAAVAVEAVQWVSRMD